MPENPVVAGNCNIYDSARLFTFPRMYLKQLVINGFKSFADRTRVKLSPGITAIVGPNGCGKSNIVDAIRWVLGEQSAKALRGGSMHDVIFSGTDKRKPLQFCEVELIFADCEKELGTAFNEVSVLRRVSRDGASDYFLNGKACRLKDIQRLFMDTGVGRVSYSFMVQGQIDQILSANPSERRSLFEEAAGITRYKTQRKEALGKLALVDQNLARVTDVLDELSRQTASLKRQASKALRYKRIRHRLTHLDLAQLAFQFSLHRAIVAEAETQAESLRGIVAGMRDNLAERERVLAESKVQRGALREKLELAQQQIFALRSEKENAESQIGFTQARTQDLRERIAGIEQEILATNARRAELEARITGGGDNKTRHAGDVATADENFRVRRRELEEFLGGIVAEERALANERQGLLLSENEITRSRSVVTNIEVDLRTSEMRHAEIGNAIAQLREERHAMEARHAEILAFAEARRAEHAKAQQDVEAARERAKSLATQFRERQQTISALDRQVAKTSAQVAMLEQLRAKFEGFSEGAKAILRGDLATVAAGAASALNSQISVRENIYAPAVEMLLGSAAEALCVADSSVVAPLMRELGERRLGRAVLAVADFAPATTVPESRNGGENLPAGIFAATTIVEAKNPANAGFVAAIFDRCFVCDDAETFLKFWRANPGLDFLLAATLEGELIDCRGLIYTRDGNAATTNSIFRRENEIKLLRERLAHENDALTDANRETMEIQAQMDETDGEIERLRAAASALAQEISAIVADERNSERALANNAEATKRQENSLAEFEAGRAAAVGKMESAGKTLAENEARIAELKKSIAQREESLAKLRAEAEAKKEAVNEIRFDLAQKKQQLEMIEREVAEIRARLADLQQRIATRESEKENMLAQIDAFSEQAEKAAARVETLSATIATAAAELAKIREESQSVEAKIEELDNSMSGDRNNLRDNEAKLGALEVRLAEETSQCKFIAEKVSTEYQLDVSAIDWKNQLWRADEEFETKVRFAELEEDDNNDGVGDNNRPRALRERGEPTEADLAEMDNTDWAPLAREVAELRERLLAMGAVNHTAIEEYGELRERFMFSKAQSDDLWSAKNELLKAIDEINETSQKLFTTTFEQIRKNFKFTFDRLFHGGESDLQLVQSEDVLDSGIEIIARPPGTRLRGISLLSGGQRTMTAVALLFAIYMVKPSPFCVLDELDAPLDDANVGRFTDIVCEFTRYSQFLVVTHNKRTVSAAGTIYGVTMQERGVTQLLSMRFNRESGDTEATGTVTESDELGKGGAFSMAR
ncbi:MAG: chromosome segregation protein SMC [Opitutae bacterium]|nr:chromosome segregation protein SMC [Opitutae bacterium]